jgi:excisionase family DNA binding protein
MSQEPLTVTIKEAKRLTGLGKTTMFALIRDGKLSVVRIGHRTLVQYESLRNLLIHDRTHVATQDCLVPARTRAHYELEKRPRTSKRKRFASVRVSS